MSFLRLDRQMTKQEGDAENAFLRTIQSDAATAFLSSISIICRIGFCSAAVTMRHIKI